MSGADPLAGRRCRRLLRLARRFAGAALIFVVPTAPAWPGGFQVRPGSPDWSANAFAGMAAKAYDASTAWSNPAGMTRLDRSEIDVGLNAVTPSIRFRGTDLVNGVPVSGTTGGDAGQTAFVPSGEAVWAVAPGIRLGVSVGNPFGLRSVWPGTFVGRYQALVSSITDTEIGFAVAYQLTPTLSIGGGPVIDHLEVRLTNALNIGPLASVTGDPVYDVHGSNWAVGYHLGVLWQPSDTLRLGIDYRSRISEDLHGSQHVAVPAALATISPAAAGGLAALDQAGGSHITLPDVLTASAVWGVARGVSALATLQWTHWSLIQTITVVGDKGSDIPLVERFRDSWMGSLGVNVRPSFAPRLLLQAGAGYERGPVTDAARTPQLPDLDTVLAGVGLSFDATRRLRLQAAYLHEFGIGGRANSYSATASAGVLTGSYSLNVDVVSLGLAWQF
ncbi:MAG: outer membrane protein transport protein [Rhodospirillales bacterium]|nr:outer membrane protein transport protein [Rhodospirillales bacterium]